MNITVINGTEKHGVTYRLKETFLTEFRDEANITEYYLPKDCPNFCVGCLNCTLKGEKTCKDAEYIRKMDESLLKADLIVMTSPAYVFHVTGAMKALLDHFAYRWMPHRPAPEMFGKRAVIITQCLGSGAKSAAKDIKHSLSWWGISEIGIFTGALMSDIVWEKLSKKKQAKLTGKVQKLSKKDGRVLCISPDREIFDTKYLECFMKAKTLVEYPKLGSGSTFAEFKIFLLKNAYGCGVDTGKRLDE